MKARTREQLSSIYLSMLENDTLTPVAPYMKRYKGLATLSLIVIVRIHSPVCLNA